MGADVAEEELRLIAEQTGGQTYLARDPADTSAVLRDALTHPFRGGPPTTAPPPS